MWHPVFIHDPETDRLEEHIAKHGEHDDVTACGIAWSTLPDIVDSNGDVWDNDKAWYADHDVDYDVPKCTICPVE
jgi:hypothetical protein